MLGQAKSKRNCGNGIYQAREMRTRYMCDLCDKQITFEHIHRSGGGLYLCPKCHKIMSSMPRDEIKDSVTVFLMRNVV
jgi:ribosomal protein L37AE/L43A